MKKMTEEEERAFRDERKRFKGYKDIQEYIEDVVILLVHSSWHYSEDRARAIVQDRMDYMQEAYDDKEPADSCCAEVGYFCG